MSSLDSDSVHGADSGEAGELDIEPELNDNTDADSALGSSGSSAAGSLTETLNSRIARGVKEYGRTYASFGNEEYGLPIDEQELDRIDMSHAKCLMILEKKLFLAPMAKNPQRILDLGTGTGIWAIDMADAYPGAEVIGVDIAPVQPTWVPPNCHFELDDIEMQWTWRKNSFDLIHARSLQLSIRDWPKLARQCYEHITPGGYAEFQTVFPKLMCDDGSTPEDSGLMEFSRLSLEASAICGFPLGAAEEYKSHLEAAGFVDVVERRFKVPSSPWPKDQRLKLIGAFELHNLIAGLSGMSLRMFSKAFGWSQERTEVYLIKVRQDMKNLNYHTYWDFVVAYGRKPESRQNLSQHTPSGPESTADVTL